jgi:hypothetical protein
MAFTVLGIVCMLFGSLLMLEHHSHHHHRHHHHHGAVPEPSLRGVAPAGKARIESPQDGPTMFPEAVFAPWQRGVVAVPVALPATTVGPVAGQSAALRTGTPSSPSQLLGGDLGGDLMEASKKLKALWTEADIIEASKKLKALLGNSSTAEGGEEHPGARRPRLVKLAAGRLKQRWGAQESSEILQ